MYLIDDLLENFLSADDPYNLDAYNRLRKSAGRSEMDIHEFISKMGIYFIAKRLSPDDMEGFIRKHMGGGPVDPNYVPLQTVQRKGCGSCGGGEVR